MREPEDTNWEERRRLSSLTLQDPRHVVYQQPLKEVGEIDLEAVYHKADQLHVHVAEASTVHVKHHAHLVLRIDFLLDRVNVGVGSQ